MKIGYKGFNKDLKCKEEKFEINQVYSKPAKANPRLCSSDGYHYCNELNDVFGHYSDNGTNRFCEIEILGDYTDDRDKSITTSFRIIRELQGDEFRKVKYERNLNLDTIKDIQKHYPMFHVGGSAGLYLHGIRLHRWAKNKSSDIDMVSPYFVLPESNDDIDIEYLNAKASANDFDETFICCGTKVDYKIDPKQRYEYIEYNGFRYKVSPLMTIMEAKMRYALNGQKKHADDIKEMIIPNKPTQQPTITINVSDLSF